MISHLAATVIAVATIPAANNASGVTSTIAPTPAAPAVVASTQKISAARITEIVAGSRILIKSIVPRAMTSRGGGLMVRAGSTGSGTRGSSSGGDPNHDVPSAVSRGAIVR